eukprot:5700957-Prymnesium_polylepis.1
MRRMCERERCQKLLGSYNISRDPDVTVRESLVLTFCVQVSFQVPESGVNSASTSSRRDSRTPP